MKKGVFLIKQRYRTLAAALLLILCAGCAGEHKSANWHNLKFSPGNVTGDRYHVDFTVEITREDDSLFSGDVELGSTSVFCDDIQELSGQLYYSGFQGGGALLLEGHAESFTSLAGQTLTLVVEDVHTSTETFEGRWEEQLPLNIEDTAQPVTIDETRLGENLPFYIEEAALTPQSIYLKVSGQLKNKRRMFNENSVALGMKDGSLLPCYGGSCSGTEQNGLFSCQIIRQLRHPAAADQVSHIVIDGVEYPVR